MQPLRHRPPPRVLQALATRPRHARVREAVAEVRDHLVDVQEEVDELLDQLAEDIVETLADATEPEDVEAARKKVLRAVVVYLHLERHGPLGAVAELGLGLIAARLAGAAMERAHRLLLELDEPDEAIVVPAPAPAPAQPPRPVPGVGPTLPRPPVVLGPVIPGPVPALPPGGAAHIPGPALAPVAPAELDTDEVAPHDAAPDLVEARTVDAVEGDGPTDPDGGYHYNPESGEASP